MSTWDRIELGFEHMLGRLGADARLRAEFEHSRAEFFSAPEVALGGQRRHLEWFLLERPSASLGGVPVQIWKDAWSTELGADPELSHSLLESIAGAFEVTSVVIGEGLWVRDLFTLGEHPVVEDQADADLAVGDLLVGRLFPLQGGTFMLSPAVSYLRNPQLLLAVRRDLEQMRAARRGVLRVQQLELEHLFHPALAVVTEQPTPAEIRAHARAELRGLGLDDSAVDDLLRQLRLAARAADGSAITEILNRLAFDTGVDLTAAQRVLAELWGVERGPIAAPAATSQQNADARAALEAFDRGRAQGQDLELLFKTLERDLGVADEAADDDEGEDDDLPGAPDFPGVVGAMVEEFLWELEREEGSVRANAWACLRMLGEFAGDIGVFDELGPVQLLDFCGRWILDAGRLSSAEEARTLLLALEGFCRWCEERHALDLWTRFGPTLSGLRTSIPRLIELRRHVGRDPGQGTYHVVQVRDGRALLRDPEGREQPLRLSGPQEAHLRDGDLVRLADQSGVPVLGAVYPPELAAFLA